jgi:ribonuclease P protein component
MLPKAFRLTGQDAFTAVLREKRYASFRELSLQWRSNHLLLTRVGFIVPKKHFPAAVDRHRAKRLLREAMRRELFPLRSGFDMIIMYRFRPDRVCFASVAESLETLLRKHNFLA